MDRTDFTKGDRVAYDTQAKMIKTRTGTVVSLSLSERTTTDRAIVSLSFDRAIVGLSLSERTTTDRAIVSLSLPERTTTDRAIVVKLDEPLPDGTEYLSADRRTLTKTMGDQCKQ